MKAGLNIEGQHLLAGKLRQVRAHFLWSTKIFRLSQQLLAHETLEHLFRVAQGLNG